MALNLHSLKRQNLPTLAALVADLGNPTAGEIAAALGVDRSTVSGWLRRGEAPRPAMLALFFVSSWGLSALDCATYNAGTARLQAARAVEDEASRLRRELARVLAVADFGTANQPLFNARTASDLLSATDKRLTSIGL